MRAGNQPGHPVPKMRRALTILVLAAMNLVMTPTLHAGAWWNGAWAFRVRLDVGANGYARYQRPVERSINFTALLASLGEGGAFVEASLRVIEVDGSGDVLDSNVVFQFDKDTDYDASSKASGTLVFLMGGTTASGATRHFDVYFDNRSGFAAASFSPRVGVTTVSNWEGQESFKITSTRATYYFHKLGGGFASAIDANGHDWIGYHPPPSGYFGEWRGIPNMGSCAHPGYTNSTSSVAWQGPLKITLLSQRNDGKQKWYTAIYPHNVTITVARSDSNYWFLYEGTPGGALAGSTQFMYQSNGTKTFLDTEWSSDISGDEWAYFSDPATNRSLYMIHHEQDNLPDSYWNGGGDGMTVFGFGRERSTTDWFMTAVPQTMSFGIMDATDFGVCTDTIRAVFKPMSITQQAAEKGSASVPSAPVLLSPANSATNQALPVVFRWNASPTATGYRLQVSTESGFSSGVVLDDSTVTDTVSSAAGLVSRTSYYWRVAAKNAAGFGAFSGIRQFQTGIKTPVLVSPANGATAQPVPVTLRWNRVANTTSYQVQVSTEASFTTGLVLDDGTVTDTTRSVSGLAATTLYYWRVKARDGIGEGMFSGSRTFTTAVPSPVLVFPANHAADVPLSLTFLWKSVPLATSYHLQVSTDPAFSSGMAFENASIVDTSCAVSGLVKNTTYFWRVSAVSTSGEGPFSAANDFATSIQPPQLLSPENGAVGLPLTLTFTWNGVAGAVRYRFELATDSTFTALVKNDTNVVDTQRTVIGLTNSLRYFWRVAVRTATALSPYSASWTFRAMLPVPEAVVLVTPPSSAEVGADSVRLCWRRTATPSTKYWINLALDAGFAMTITDSSADTSRVYTGLTADRTYWWRVRGGNGEAWGAYSEVRQFTTRVLGVETTDGEGLPTEYALKQNYPNPFNPATTIGFALPQSGTVRLEVCNVLGGIVATPIEGWYPAGHHSIRIDASLWPSGTYFYRLSAGGRTFVRRMLFLK